MINIDLFDGNYDAYQINVFNALGQQVRQQDLTPQMDFSSYTSGIYF